jgi:hypothetical protein
VYVKRVTPHRLARDDRKSRELADLKRENHQLHRTVQRLRREIDRLKLLTPESEEPPDVVEKVETSQPTCPECGSADVASFSTPAGSVRRVCKHCRKAFS